MATYTIPEININKLERRINTLRKKCEKYNFTFRYDKVKEIYQDFITPEGYKVTEKCYLVRLEGKVLHEGWTLVGKVERLKDGLNLVHRFSHEFKVPDKYYYSDLTCDHCQSHRPRRYTYILRNEFGEWLQVGTGCVLEFTNGGLDVEDIAYFAQTFDFAQDIQELSDETIQKRKLECRVNLEEALAFAYRTITIHGYRRSSEEDSTKERLLDMLSSIATSEPTSTETCFANDCIKYFAHEIDDTNEYIHNCKSIAKVDYPEIKLVGFIAAMMNTYINMLNERAKVEKENSEVVNEYLGNVGDKLTLNIKSWKCVFRQITVFGDNYLYRFITNDNHIVTWGTSTRLEEGNIITITGTVKEHNEYKGTKQTRLTRCKVAYI